MNIKKLKNISGLTLIEILVGVVVSAIMITAMYTTYSVVNNSYSKVTDRAKISSSGRDIVELLMRDIRIFFILIQHKLYIANSIIKKNLYLIIIFTSILPIRLYTNICSNCRNITIYLPQLHQYLKYINIYHFDEKGILLIKDIVVFLMMIDLLESSIAWR